MWPHLSFSEPWRRLPKAPTENSRSLWSEILTRKGKTKMLVRNPILTSATNMGTLLGRKGKNNPQKYSLKVQWNIWFWVRLWGQQSKPGHGGYEKNFHCCKAKHLSEKMWPLLHCWTIQPRFSGHPGHSPWTATLNFTVKGWCQYKTLWLV